jgi:hypothetical protein
MAQKYSEQYKSLVTPLSDSSPDIQKLKKDADTKYKEAIAGYDNRLGQMSAMRQQDMMALRKNAQVAESKLDDDMFQRYLQTRENMGVRGLSNSGLMADAQMRLGMNKQDALADLFARTQSQINDVNRMYAPQQQALLAEKQSIKQSDVEKAMRDQFMQQRLQQAQALTPLIQLTERSAESYAQEKLQRDQMAAQAAAQKEAAKAQADAQAAAQSKADRTAMANYYAQTIAGSHTSMISTYQNQIDGLDKDSETYATDLKRLQDAIKQEYNAQKAAFAVGEAYMSGDANKIAKAVSSYQALGIGATGTQKMSTKPPTQQNVKSSQTLDANNYLQQVLDNPYYTNTLGFSKYNTSPRDKFNPIAKTRQYPNTDRYISLEYTNQNSVMTPLEAANRIILSGQKPVISVDLLKKYEDVANAGFFDIGTSKAESAAAKEFLDFYYNYPDFFTTQ